MATNLISSVMQFVTPDLIAKIAAAIGLDRNTAQKATSAGIPAILASLAGLASKPGGAQQLSSALEQVTPGGLNNFLGAIGSPTQAARSEEGTNLLSSLLGSGPLNALTSAIGSHAGINASKSESLLGLLGPIAIGALGQQQAKTGLDPKGVVNLLASQKDQIAAALPSGLSSYLRDSGLAGALDGTIRQGAAAASAAGRRTADIGESAMLASRQAAAATSQQMATWPFWLAGLAILTGLGWMYMANRDNTQVAEQTSRPAATKTETMGAGTPSQTAAELTGQLTRSVDGMRTTLQGITDPASAQAAMPKLQQMTTDLDKLSAATNQLSPQTRSLVAAELSSAMPALNQLFDRVLAIPGVASIAQPLIETMRTKLNAMSRA
ncbi:DUF937 domain-containing protein [Pseudorhodoplanes sinuspersici]|nr:DUF937 domain-containing protein [Pseudorhodoplanes sinuspersici]RKE73423.1 uncharacterized protein DUF937 [Pseudorhodoplanes sinuspersici]